MNKHIGAFGEVMMRLEVPDYKLLTQSSSLNYSFSGTGVNVLTALANFGYQSSLITTLPDNPLGNAAQAHLRKLGISTPYVKRNGHYLGMFFLESGFGMRPSRVTYTNRLESSFNSGSHGLYDFNELAHSLDVVHFCGISLAMNDSVRSQMKNLATATKKQGGTVLFDCNYRPSLWGENDGYKQAKPHYESMLRLADIVMMNEQDALHILGMKTDQTKRKDQLTELIPLVAQKYKIKAIAGTHRTINENNTHSLTGYLFKDDTFYFSHPLTFSVLDRIGAGDAYSSGILHGLLAGFSEEGIVDFATRAAMLAHTYSGDTPLPTLDEVINASTDHTSDIKR